MDGHGYLLRRLERLASELDVILSREFSPDRSRRLEALDELTESIWEYLDVSTPRSYGEGSP